MQHPIQELHERLSNLQRKGQICLYSMGKLFSHLTI